MPDRLALVTGASGAVGPAVVRACLAAGYAVRTLSLDLPGPDVLPSGIDARTGDICDVDAVRDATQDAEVVVHLAALLHQFENRSGLDRDFERINVGGTENVARAAAAAGARRIVLLSTIAVYGPSSGRLLDEASPPAPDTSYGRTKLAAERLVLSARDGGGQPVGTVLRAAAVYGSRVKGNYRRLAETIARGRFVPLGRALNRRTVVHDTDLARAVALVADHPAAGGAVYNVSDGSIHTLSDIIRAIYRATGRHEPRLFVPLGAVRAGVAVCEGGCRLLGVRPPVTSALIDKYTEDVAVDSTRIRRALGFVPTIDLDAGWKETMASLGGKGC